MPEEASLEGWTPLIGADVTLDTVVDLAFDYRGDVTVVRTDGSELTGYVYNRDRHAAEPYLLIFDPGGDSHRVGYADIRAITFSGKDTAAGKSYDAWLRRKAQV